LNLPKSMPRIVVMVVWPQGETVFGNNIHSS
jgi:hypothetical protein